MIFQSQSAHTFGRSRVVLAALALVGAAACGSTSDSSSPASPSDGTDMWDPPTEAGIHDLPQSPLSLRMGEIVAVSGNYIVVFGGQSPANASERRTAFNDGAVFDIKLGGWTEMASSPFEPSLQYASAARSGDDVVFLGEQCRTDVPPPTEDSPDCSAGPASARYSPANNEWTLLDPTEVEDALGPSNNGIAGGPDGVTYIRPYDELPASVFDNESTSWSRLDIPTFADLSPLACVGRSSDGDVVRILNGPDIPGSLTGNERDDTDISFSLTEVTSMAAGATQLPDAVTLSSPIELGTPAYYWIPTCSEGGIYMEISNYKKSNPVDGGITRLFVNTETGEVTDIGLPPDTMIVWYDQPATHLQDWLIGIDETDFEAGVNDYSWAWSPATGWIELGEPLSYEEAHFAHPSSFNGGIGPDDNLYSVSAGRPQVMVLPEELRAS